VKPGDHVDVILVNGDQETKVLTNVEVASVTTVDTHTDAVDLNVTREDAQDFTTAIKTVTHDRTQLQKTSTN
jgi:Flp pilus assembly protein CpaB